jgi:hypothetical protein
LGSFRYHGNGTGYDLYIWNEPTPCWTYQLNTAVAPYYPSIITFVKEEVIYILRKRFNQKFVGLLNNGNVSFPIQIPVLALMVVRGFNLVIHILLIDWKSGTGWLY